jgi:hypothetical protein
MKMNDVRAWPPAKGWAKLVKVKDIFTPVSDVQEIMLFGFEKVK